MSDIVPFLIYYPLCWWTTLLDELSSTLLDDEHLPKELTSVQLLCLLDNSLDFICPDDKSCKTQNTNTTWIHTSFITAIAYRLLDFFKSKATLTWSAENPEVWSAVTSFESSCLSTMLSLHLFLDSCLPDMWDWKPGWRGGAMCWMDCCSTRVLGTK